MAALLERLDRTAADLAKRRRGRAGERVAKAAAFFVHGVLHVWRNRRYLTALKLANMALVNLQYAWKSERVFGRPYRMKIESTNLCNTQCQLCPTGVGLDGRPKGRMTLDQYRALVDRLRRFLYVLDLSMFGDPLIFPDIYPMIRHAHQRGIWTYLSTNLHALRPERGDAETLVASGLDMLTCSLHGASQTTFEAYQPGKSFAKTLDKLHAVLAARAAAGRGKPVIQLNFVVTRFNEHERQAFQQLADSLDCRALFSVPSANVRFLDRDDQLRPLGLDPQALAARVEERLERWMPQDPDFVIEPYRRMREGRYDPSEFNGQKIMECDWLWRSSVVNWDGSVVACCGVYESADDFGNVFERPFGEIWNGRAYRMARRSFKRPVESPQGYANPCRECPGFLV